MRKRTLDRLDRFAGLVLVIVVCLVVATLPLGAVANAPAATQPAPRQRVHEVDHRLDVVRQRVVALERVARRYRTWTDCTHLVPVDEAGDRDHRFGFFYEQLDGTGLDYRPALVRHRGPGRSDLVLLAMEPRRACASSPVRPNGTGADAKVAALPASAKTPRPLVTQVRVLERRIAGLARRIATLNRVANRFDEWESCLSALPVTAQGDPSRRFGHLFRGANGRTFRHALGVDRSEWDDPDYQLLAFLGRDRPFNRRECSRDPGEAADKRAVSRRVGAWRPEFTKSGELTDTIDQLVVDSRELAEDLPDLRTALTEFTSFDECMFLLGVTSLGSKAAHTGYLYLGRHGRQVRRPALALALDGTIEPRWNLMAFPGEEPPQIECNEDASGQETEE